MIIMKKIMSMIIVSALIISMAVGCGKKNEVSSDPVSSEVSSVSSEIAAFSEESCIALLNRMFDCQPGSAGSSLKAVLVAVDVLNWTEANSADTATVTATVQKFYDGLEDSQKADFKLCYNMVNSDALDVISGTNDIASYLDAAGAVTRTSGYSLEKYKVLADAIETVIK